jgi:hypothetical protein
MLTYETPQEAIRQFLGTFMDNTRGQKEVVRRYEVAGAVCQISRSYGRKMNRPRWQWIEPIPRQYAGINMTDYIQNRYMVPWARPQVPVVEPEPEEPTDFKCGVAVTATDTEYYADLLKKLHAKNLFPGVQVDEDEEFIMTGDDQ